MTTFIFLLIKILPFCLFGALGYILAKNIKLNFEKLAKFFIYIVSPPVVFYGTQQINLHSGELFLPIIYFILSSLLTLIFFFVGKKFFKDGTEYLLGLTVGINNVGNMGVPLAIAVFGSKALGPAVLILFGGILYGNTVGYFTASKGHYGTKDALINTVKLPTLYAFILGIVIHILGVVFTKSFINVILSDLVSIYSVLGLLIAGVGMASIKKESLDKTYLIISMIATNIVWPLVVFGLLIIDITNTHLLTDLGRKVSFLQSLMPIGINVISYAAITKIHPEKAALAVAVSTISAVIYIPIMLALFLRFL